MDKDKPVDGCVTFAFTETVRRSFVLNGKRHTVDHLGIPAGTYKLVAALRSHAQPK